jgi:hypothetical protein
MHVLTNGRAFCALKEEHCSKKVEASQFSIILFPLLCGIQVDMAPTVSVSGYDLIGKIGHLSVYLGAIVS